MWAPLLSLSACAGGPVTKAEVCVEIPFLDGAEGACTITTEHKAYLKNKETWAKERPFMIMIHAKYWTEIKKDWLKACHMMGPKCNVAVDSVDKTIKRLEGLAKPLIEPLLGD